MADEKLRQELLYMVRLTSKYDLSKMEVVEGILRLENERQILGSVFGKRFKSRIFDVAAGVEADNNCVICGQPAENKIICKHCLESIGNSNYAKNQIKIEKTPINWKKILKYIALVCLILILLFQIWVLSLWRDIISRNPIEEPRNSAYELVAVASLDEALAQLQKDFPESEGYTVSFVRMDKDYAGRFLLDTGACCLEVEESLTEEQMYDYYLTDEVYVFYISYLDEHKAKLGIAEVNQAGAIIIEGSFNDGRRTDSFYKFR